MTTAWLILRAWWKQILTALILLYLASAAYNAIHHYGQRQYQAGRAAVIAENALANARAQEAINRRDVDSAAAGTLMHTQLDIALPKLEVTTHDAADKIRTIYLAAPAVPAAVCVRPAGVQEQLDAARTRANTAAAGQL